MLSMLGICMRILLPNIMFIQMLNVQMLRIASLDQTEPDQCPLH